MNAKLIQIIEFLYKWKGNEDALLHDGTQLICRLPQESPLGYLHKLYPPLNTLDIEKIEILLKVSLPLDYLDFLLAFNGMDLFNENISIFGLRKSSESNNYNKFFQPRDIIIENLEKRFENNYFLFAIFLKKHQVFFKSGDYKIYVKQLNNKETIIEYQGFYDWLNYCINYLLPYYDQLGMQVKDIK